MENISQPDYKRIYTDMISRKYPHKKEICEEILKKKQLSTLEVITINDLIFGQEQEKISNQMHRSYDKATIFELLKFQEKNNLNNSQLSRHTKLSRNTIIRWKKLFLAK